MNASINSGIDFAVAKQKYFMSLSEIYPEPS